MSDEFEITPKLGRIGNRGNARAKGTLRKLQKAAARKSSSAGRRSNSGYSGQRFGRGAGLGALSKTRAYAKSRRAVVKVHIARAGSMGTGGFSKHVSYIRRDGTERDGSASQIYDRESEIANEEEFTQRGSEDTRQFRIILSPEDGHEIEDMKQVTRAFMAEVERDLGESLDWVAADHHNTSHPHTHIVIRGGRAGHELIIAKDYITHGLRARAQEVLTNELGLRRETDIARAQNAEVTKDRFTSIDRAIEGAAVDGVVRLSPRLGSAARFDHALQQKRLAHLEDLGLATHQPGRWQLTPRWQDTLKALGRDGDIIRTLSAQVGKDGALSKLRRLDAAMLDKRPMLGALMATGPGDELRNGRVALILGEDGQSWAIDLTEMQARDLPAKGGILELSYQPPAPRASDRVIASIASDNDGIYSDDLHAAADPAASAAFRLAHKRRLEALRRGGVAERLSDERWRIPADFEKAALAFDVKRAGPSLVVRSWLQLDALVTHADAGWLDTAEASRLASQNTELGTQVRGALGQRQEWLIDKGVVTGKGVPLSVAQMADMQAKALGVALQTEAQKRGLHPVRLTGAGSFTGLYAANLDLPQGRFAVVQTRSKVMLAPWRSGLGHHRGKVLTLTMKGQRLNWQLQRTLDRSR